MSAAGRDELVDAVALALERAETRGRVATAWLRRTFPTCWERVREVLDAARGIGAEEPPLPSLGPFRPLRRLGRGAMGSVYLAEATEPVLGLRTGRRVALKVSHPQREARPGVGARFLREAKAGALVRHPGVVRSFGAIELPHADGPTWAVAMEFVRGTTLRRLLDDGAVFAEGSCLAVGVQVADALAAVHAAGVVHRDVKPSNLLRLSTGRVKLLDLGLAWLRDETLRLSLSGQFLGSFLYAAPEQLLPDRGPVDARADLHSLGVTLFELAAGRLPWGPRAGPWVLPTRDGLGPPRLRDVVPEASPDLASVVDRLLASSPAARFESATSLRDALASVRPPAEEAVGVRGRADEPEGVLRAVVGAWAAARRGERRAVLLVGPSFAASRARAERLADRIERGGLPGATLLLPDLGRADAAARRHLARALAGAGGSGALLLAAVRSEDAEAWASLPEARERLALVRVDGAEGAASDPLDGLSPEDVALVRWAARFGGPFDPEEVARACGRSSLDVVRTLAHLGRERDLFEWRDDGRAVLRPTAADALRARDAGSDPSAPQGSQG